MEKKLFLLPIISLISLSLTGCKVNTSTSDAFFSDDSLKNVGLYGLPPITFSSSYITIYRNDFCEGYFNISKGHIHEYARKVLDYFKSSSIDYACEISSSSSLAGFFTTHTCLENAVYLPFYQTFEDIYIFYYKYGSEIFNVQISLEDHSTSGKNYNCYMYISNSRQVDEWLTNEYKEVVLTKENLSDYADLHVKYTESLIGERFLSVRLDLDYLKYDIHMDVNVNYKGDKQVIRFDHYPYDASNQCYHYFDVTSDYQEGDLVIEDYTLVSENVILYKNSGDMSRNSF